MAVQSGNSERSLISLFLLSFILLTALHGAVLYFIHHTQYNRNLDLIKEYQENLIRLEQQKISSEIQSALEKLSFLEMAVEHSVESGRLPEEEKYTTFFKEVGENSGEFSVLRLISTEGQELFRMNFDADGRGVRVPASELQDKKDRYYFQELKEYEDSIYISPLDLNIENNQLEVPYQPVIRFGRAIQNGTGDSLAYLILNFRAQIILDDLGVYEQLPREEFNTYLINNEGYWLKGPSADREFGFMHEGLENETVAYTNSDLWVHLQIDEKGMFYQDGDLFLHRTLPMKNLIRPEWGQYTSRNHQNDRSFYLVYHTSRTVLHRMSADIVRSLFFPFLITQALIILISAAGAWSYGMYRKSRAVYQFLSCLDELTECLNRNAGIKILDKTRSLVHRRNSALTVVYTDVSNLKKVNDRYGYSAGERYLLTMVGLVRQQLRNSDFLIRLDEEGFLMILPDCSEEHTIEICGRIQGKVNELNRTSVYPYDLVLSLGILESHREIHQSAEQLIEDARMMMERNRTDSGGSR